MIFYLVLRMGLLTISSRLTNRNPFSFALNALTMTIGNINDAPVMMNALAFKDIRLTVPELRDRVLYHYKQDVLRQLYRILGSADFIGNPVGLFNTVSSGVADIFYEPFHGVVMRGNKEFGIGLAKVIFSDGNPQSVINK
jgi:vacuolar protein sorting-associated protein 13A/C